MFYHNKRANTATIALLFLYAIVQIAIVLFLMMA